MDKEDKKKLLVQLLKDIAEIQSEAVALKNKNVAAGLKRLLENLLKETIDFRSAIHYINNSMEKSKSNDSKVLWIKVFIKVEKYFEAIE